MYNVYAAAQNQTDDYFCPVTNVQHFSPRMHKYLKHPYQGLSGELKTLLKVYAGSLLVNMVFPKATAWFLVKGKAVPDTRVTLP